MGGRRCDALPAEVRVAHRCPCVVLSSDIIVVEEEEQQRQQRESEAVCGAEEALVTSLARKGLMPPISGRSEASVALLGG